MSNTSNTLECSNYDCGSSIRSTDAFYDSGYAYCNYDCAFAHCYDMKWERKHAHRAAAAASAAPALVSVPTPSPPIATPMIVCSNYDCQTELAKVDAFYEDERPYCGYDCAFNHYYDLKRERRRDYYAAVAK